jgi:IS4 transposase
LQRKSKLKPEEFIDTLMFSSFDNSQFSLQECCNDLAQQHQKSFSKVALHKRFNARSLDFLKSVLAEQVALKLDIKQENCWQQFNRVLIADSSKFSLPGQYKDDYPGYGNFAPSLMNIQYCFDLKGGDWENLELTKATQNDKSHSKGTLHQIYKDDLHIRDLGYVTHEYLATVVSKEAFFLNRLHPQWKPVQQSNGKAIEWTALYLKMQQERNNRFETTVTIKTNKAVFNCRLIAATVPEQVWAERIRKAQVRAKSMGSPLSDEYKARCRFSIFITNVKQEMLQAADIIQLYRLRWQIELVFKTWKSLLNIHKVKAVKKDRLECQLFARFIWILVNWKIFRCIDIFIQKNTPGYACSLWKFFKQARYYDYGLRKLVNNKMNIDDWLDIFIYPIIKNLLIEPKKGKDPAFVIVNQIFNPLG